MCVWPSRVWPDQTLNWGYLSSALHEGIIYRFRTGIAWRDLPASFGPWQTVWERHQRFSTDGTWDKIHARLVADADAVGDLDWTISVDSTVNRAHQHATNRRRTERPAGGLTGG